MRLWIRWLTSLVLLLVFLAALGFWAQRQRLETREPATLFFPSPYSLGTVGERVAVVVSSRQSGVVRVELWADGEPVAATTNAVPSAAPWEVTLAWRPNETGPHTLFARLYTADGAVLDTALRTLEVVPPGALAYVTAEQGTPAVMVARTDGLKREVWALEAKDPAWANEVVLFVVRDGGIWTLTGPHNRPRPIVNAEFQAERPAWGGKTLAFTSRKGGRPRVLLRSAAGDITALPFQAEAVMDPAWNPNGDELVVAATRDGNTDLYRISLRTGEVQQLTTHPATDRQPTWSPDGRVLLFVSDRDGVPQVYWLALTGKQAPVPVTDVPFGADHPSWSPDGTWFAYSAQLGATLSSRELVLQRLRDNYAVRVTFNNVEDTAPAWQPTTPVPPNRGR